MNYISTRGRTAPVCFADAVMMGMARDGGLLLPESIPDVSDQLDKWRNLSYPDLALEIICLYCSLPRPVLRGILSRSYQTFDLPDITPVVAVGDLFVLELFHGPTLAFKDLALQFMGNLFSHILGDRQMQLNILVATSGDTGSAAIHGIRGRPHMSIVVMHPRGRISPTQEQQMTSVLDTNVFNLAVDGSFDDCQQMLKTIFADLDFKDRYSLGAVNSINWGRLLAQTVYYFYAAFRVMDCTGAREFGFSVPTGNFGDIFAGYVAARMGLPIRQLVLATNENDVLARFFSTGEYRPMPVQSTISPSMDIQVASNFERYLFYRLGSDAALTATMMDAFSREGNLRLRPGDGRVDDLFVPAVGRTQDALNIIQRFHSEYGYLMDPHTAVGVHAAIQNRQAGIPMICLSTAHPAKFPESIQRAIGKDLARHPTIEALKDLPTRCDSVPASASAVRNYISSKVPVPPHNQDEV